MVLKAKTMLLKNMPGKVGNRFPILCNVQNHRSVRKNTSSPLGLENKIKQLISEQLGVKKGVLSLEKTFIEFGVDSLEIVELILALEEEFQIEIPDDELPQVQTIKGILHTVMAKQSQSKHLSFNPHKCTDLVA